MNRLASVLILTVLAIACSDTDPAVTPRPESTTSSSDPSSAPGDGSVTDCPGRPTGSSPASFDAAEGTYASIPTGFDRNSRQISFDIVQWLSGDDANEAYEAETGDPSGAPNDYYVVNESDQVRTAEVTMDAKVLVLQEDANASSLTPRPLADLAAHIEASGQNIYWLTFSARTVTVICQQYRP